mmetsp:Transcript_12470/g.47918  ORF Transcript_12470/g.47918 Transcript_12470/m.47918 type:complete len:242 (+) Transcript_12470:1871-2596(+)
MKHGHSCCSLPLAKMGRRDSASHGMRSSTVTTVQSPPRQRRICTAPHPSALAERRAWATWPSPSAATDMALTSQQSPSVPCATSEPAGWRCDSVHSLSPRSRCPISLGRSQRTGTSRTSTGAVGLARTRIVVVVFPEPSEAADGTNSGSEKGRLACMLWARQWSYSRSARRSSSATQVPPSSPVPSSLLQRCSEPAAQAEPIALGVRTSACALPPGRSGAAAAAAAAAAVAAADGAATAAG